MLEGAKSTGKLKVPEIIVLIVLAVALIIGVVVLVFLVKAYLTRLDARYIDLLRELAQRNRDEANKANAVALHEISFSWTKGVSLSVKTITRNPTPQAKSPEKGGRFSVFYYKFRVAKEKRETM